MKSDKKKKVRRNAINIVGISFLIAAVVLIIFSRLFIVDILELKYVEFLDKLYEFQLIVASLSDKWLIIVIIELLFILKSVIPIPLSFVFVISGMVFPYSYAVLINAVGMALLMTIKYYWGEKLGIGKLDRKWLNYEPIQKFLNTKYGKGLMLFLSRLIPWTPTNKVSQIYGTMDYPFDRYLLISLVGYTPKIFSYSIIGRNVYNPISLDFVAPFIFLLAISGTALLILNAILGMMGEMSTSAADGK
ncbi:MAG: VTT domain-containing protein [Clostridia bacterium]|nr:VTT domain-containing protein [Clostridia bacterium]